MEQDARNNSGLHSDWDGWTDAQIETFLDAVINNFFEVVGCNESGEQLYRRKPRRG